MDLRVQKIIFNIKSLKIQGARNVAKMAVHALVVGVTTSKAKTTIQLEKEIKLLSKLISQSRPTEPMMRNMIVILLDTILFQIQRKEDISSIKKFVLQKEDILITEMENSLKRIAEYGAKLIPDDSLILTHCHSSSVTNILRYAKRTGKEFEVICCETRPLFQGRITALELAKAKIKTTLIVDGAVNLFMKKADIVLVGADSVTSRGDLINKVGTSTVAHIARMHDVSFYSAAELLKYSSKTFFGEREEIEERNPKEVLEKAMSGVSVRNPAFDVTASEYLRGYITEGGIIPPQSFFSLAREKLRVKF